MISKSDLIIIVVASSALAVGIFRWHQHTQDVNAITIPASATSGSSNPGRVVVEPVQNNSAQTVTPAATAAPTTTVQTQTAPSAEVANAPVNTSIQSDANGQVVVKTITQQPVAEVVIEADTSDAQNLGTHQVRSGDNLSKIANQYGTDVQTLRNLNNISGSIIQIGQEIRYPL